MYGLTKLKKTKGLTFVEVVIASAIAVIVVSMIFMIYSSGNDLWETKRYQADLEAAGRQALETMTKELKQTTRTSTQTPSPNINIAAAPNNKNIDFYLPADLNNDSYITDNNGNVEWDTNNKIQYLYTPAQKELNRLKNSTQTTTLAQDVTDIQFIDNSIDGSLYLNELKINMTITKTTPRQRNLSMTFIGLVKLRN
jgi:Tfp pilus assembly protein PilW